MRIVLVVLALSFGAACERTPGRLSASGPVDAGADGEPSSDVGDSGDLADAGRAEDGGDAGVTDPDAGCVEPETWTLQARATDGAQLLDRNAARIGSTQRILVSVEIDSDCERDGPVVADVMPGDATDFVQITARSWVSSQARCSGQRILQQHVIDIDAQHQGNLNVVVFDTQRPGGGMLLSFLRASSDLGIQCTGSTERGTVTAGGSCASDCDCAPGLPCVPVPGAVADAWQCAAACASPLQCSAGERCRTGPRSASPSWVCEAAPPCRGPEDCPQPAFDCVGADGAKSCQDVRRFDDRTCRCSVWCGVGAFCATDGAADVHCAIPCEGPRDCPIVAGSRLRCGASWMCGP